MGIIPRVTCRRCGRQFSGVRNRCPYCGTRRIKQSDRVPGTTPGQDPSTPAGQRASVNTRWQMMFGGILVAAVILAVIVLVSVSLNGTGIERQSPSPSIDPAASASPTPTPTPTPMPTPTPSIESINIYYGSSAMNDDVTFNLADGNTVTLTVQVWPVPEGGMESIAGDLQWSVSNPDIATLSTEGNSCTITFTGVNGSFDLSVSCYGRTDTCVVRTRGGTDA